MSSVITRNVRITSLLHGPSSTPPSSSREGFPMVHFLFTRRPTGICSLPVELITRIFVLGSRFDYPYADSPFLLKPDQEYVPVPSSNFQVNVSHVCQHWRQVALRTPVLWTTLHFREMSHIPRAKEYLARCSKSSAYLLDILIDTIAVDDHTPGVTLYKDETRTIFQIIIPHVKRWRAFHLKICDNDCKGLARQFLSTCGPAPNLETLQLYHFEDYRTTQNLYLATYRPPVIVFSNTLPRLTNVSLIGVNLPWEKSPYLTKLRNLELGLHSDNIRPPYEWWNRILRLSPELESLCLHYSGPKESSGEPALAWPDADDRTPLTRLEDLSFIDLDPDYLCNLLERLYLPGVRKLTLDLPDQNFTPFIELITGPFKKTPVGGMATAETNSPTTTHDIPIPSLANLQSLTIRALECSQDIWVQLMRTVLGVRFLQVDFARVGPKFWQVFSDDCELSLTYSESSKNSLVLPNLELLKVSGVSGRDILAALHHRYRHPRAYNTPTAVKWILGWTEKKRGIDLELDALVDRGCWIAAAGAAKVTIEAFDNEDDEVEEADNDIPNSSDEDQL